MKPIKRVAALVNSRSGGTTPQHVVLAGIVKTRSPAKKLLWNAAYDGLIEYTGVLNIYQRRENRCGD